MPNKIGSTTRTMQETITIMQDLQDRGVFVRTLDGLIDTEKMQMMAPLVVGLLAGLANVERNRWPRDKENP